MAEIHNIAAEQALLGAVLLNNDVMARAGGIVRDADFADPVHAEIWAACASRIAADQMATPTTLALAFEGHPGLAQLGGPAYLVRLAGAAVSIFAAKDYAQIVARCARKRRLAETLAAAAARLMDDDADVDVALGMVEAQSLSEETQPGASAVVPFRQALAAAVAAANEADLREGVVGVTSGIDDLDAETGGFMAGELIILAGRPAMGKSAVALSMALAAARVGHGVAICSLEMTPAEIGIRALSSEAARHGDGFAYRDARRGSLPEGGVQRIVETARAIEALPIEFTPPACRDIASIHAAVRRIQSRYEAEGGALGLVVIDYLQLIQPSTQRRGGNRQEDVAEISAALKGMAMRLNVPVLALSQLSRAVESRDDKRPQMGDLRESGAIEQDANTIIMCFREEYYLRREEPHPHESPDEHADWHSALQKCAGLMDLIIVKQRMGDTPTVTVRFDAPTNSLSDTRSRL